MKMNGKKVNAVSEEVVVIPRRDEDYVFKARAVLNYEDHDKLNPIPQPPTRVLPGGIKQQNTENPDYKKNLAQWSTRKYHWMVLQSLTSATEWLEFETVEMDDPTTWANYVKEMEASGLSQIEIARIQEIVMDACGLNQAKIDEATKRFLRGQGRVPSSEPSPDSEQNSTQPSEPVSEPVSASPV